MRTPLALACAVLGGLGVGAAARAIDVSDLSATAFALLSAWLIFMELRPAPGGPPPPPGTPLLRQPRPRRRILSIVAIVLAFGLLLNDLAAGDVDVDSARQWILDLGPWGPALLIVTLAIAMIVAPLPNPPFMIAAGLVWGTFWGVVYSLAGQLLGSAIIFLLSRRFGRRLVPVLIGQRSATAVDQLAREMGPQLVFWWRMLPVAFDLGAYAAGLTTMSFRLFITLVFFGSIIPTTVVVSFGDSFNHSWEATVVSGGLIVLAIVAPLLAFTLRYRGRLPELRALLRSAISGDVDPRPADS